MTVMRTLPFFFFASLLIAGDHPLSKDRTGMKWALPFQAALEKAKAQKRLLLIKPVAFGTSADGGW